MTRPTASQLSPAARRILARTRAAQAAIDERVEGQELVGGPPELGAKRDVPATWLARDIVKQRRPRL